jgi:hypothetical protein
MESGNGKCLCKAETLRRVRMRSIHATRSFNRNSSKKAEAPLKKAAAEEEQVYSNRFSANDFFMVCLHRT